MVIFYYLALGTKQCVYSTIQEIHLIFCKLIYFILTIFDFVSFFLNNLKRCECASQVWSCTWNLDDPNIIYAGLNSGRVQVFDRRQVQTGETTLSSSSETLSLSTTSPIVSLQYIQRNSNFHSNGLLVGSNDKSGFYEHIPNSEYRYHALPIDSKLIFFILK